ncbi:phage tail assembly chaperone [Chromobacterium haemolyticum]|uniref:phage tail assembly chaperone n=1 Tax=Chromobacterium haemolyticum TaxID=394935 RepID=UPI00193B46B9|nr:phage tail assembly chaperone [Chromobacterium haemolyticum]
MAKLTLAAAPTFPATVAIPVPGGGTADVVFTFKHCTKSELRKRIEKLEQTSDIDLIESCTAGWDLDDEFNRANLVQLLENHHGAALVAWNTFVRELTGLRQGN